jgi:hypothetical protein
MVYRITIAIEFGLPKQSSAGLPPAGSYDRLIRLVESPTKSGHTFILYDGSRRIYALTADETEQLLHLLGQIVLQAPWEAVPAVRFDGPVYTLLLKGPLSEAMFNWGWKMPKEWESVGAVVDYVLGLAERYELLRSR